MSADDGMSFRDRREEEVKNLEMPAFFREGIALVCTGRGTHRRKDLFQVHLGGGWDVKFAKRHYGAGATGTGPGPRMYRPVWLGSVNATNKDGKRLGRAHNFDCPVCGRKASINDLSMALVHRAGFKSLDLSYAEDTIRILKHLEPEPEPDSQ